MLKHGRARRQRWGAYAAALALLLAGGLIVIDFYTWIELDVAALFALPLTVAALSGRRLLLWALAGVLLVTTFVVYSQQIAPSTFSLREPFFLNRVLDAVAMLVTAGLLHALTLAMEQIERQNAQISAQNERKTRLLASVSHDISTPLTSMNVIAQLIRGSADRQSGGADVARLAATLEANAHALAELFSDLLDISSIDSGTVPLRETEFALDELLREECRVLEPLAHEKGLRLAVDAPAQLRVQTDRIKLARVVRNILGNALKFTDAGAITASCRASGGAVEIRIADSGVGIAPADRERIFLEFTQLNGASAGERAGWGLGLAICRRLVVLMGGTIEVESEPGRGSTFIVRLPAGTAPG